MFQFLTITMDERDKTMYLSIQVIEVRSVAGWLLVRYMYDRYPMVEV